MSNINLNKDNNTTNIPPAAGVPAGGGFEFAEKKPPKNGRLLLGFVAALVVIFALAVGGLIYGIYSVYSQLKTVDEPQVTRITTPDGVTEVPSEALEAFFDAVKAQDTTAMTSILDEYPAIIYEQQALYPEIDDVILHGTTEMVQIMLDCGVKLDDRFQYEPREFVEYSYSYSLENYFNRHKKSGDGTRELAMVSFLIDNGALTTYGYSGDALARKNAYGDTVGYHQPNALFSAAAWVCEDNELTSADKELIERIIAAGVDTSAKNAYGETVREYFTKNVSSNDVPVQASAAYDEILTLLP